MIYVLKIIFMLVLTALLSHCASLVVENYNIANSWCVDVEGNINTLIEIIDEHTLYNLNA